MPDVEPGEGDVRIKVEVSGLSPGDVKKRAGWQGAPMPFPRVMPHSDGAGTIDAVGVGVDPARIGERVWCYGGSPIARLEPRPSTWSSRMRWRSLYRRVVLQNVSWSSRPLVWASPGLPAIERSLPTGRSMVCTCWCTVRLVVWARSRRRWPCVEATVIAGVREGQQQRARELGAQHVIVTDDPDATAAIRQIAPAGVARIAEVDLASHIDLDADVIATGGVICSYFSAVDRPEIPYWKLGFADTTLRLLGSDDSRLKSKPLRQPSCRQRCATPTCVRKSPSGFRSPRSHAPTNSSNRARAAA